MNQPFIQCPSPNFDCREGQQVDMLVMHYTGMPTAEHALWRLTNDASNVSSHYMITQDGRVYSLVPENMRAWHAGASFWRGHTNINQRSIGIELVNPGHEFGYQPFPPAQMEALAYLAHDILSRHFIPPHNIVGHSDIAPSRKDDPGELFDWAWLARQGIGLWPPSPASGGEDAGQLLAAYGYDMRFPQRAVLAFQRHFRPAKLTGLWDSECAGLLAALLAMV